MSSSTQHRPIDTPTDTPNKVRDIRENMNSNDCNQYTSQRRITFVSVNTLNKRLKKKLEEVDEQIDKLSKYMEDGDLGDKKVKALITTKNDLQDTYKIYYPVTDCNFIVRKIPLPSSKWIIKKRQMLLDGFEGVKEDAEKTTNRRAGLEPLIDYAFCSVEAVRSELTLPAQNEPWQLQFKLFATSNSVVTWESILEYSESEFQEWWKEKHVVRKREADSGSQEGHVAISTQTETSDGWPDLKALCKAIVFAREELSFEYTQRFASVKRLSKSCETLSLVAVKLFSLYSTYREQSHGVSFLLGLAAPIVFSIWKVITRARNAKKDGTVLQNLVSDALSTAVNELESMVQKVHKVTTVFGSILLADPYISAAKENSSNARYISKLEIRHLFNKEDLPDAARKQLIETELFETDSVLDDVFDGIQKVESEGAMEIILNNQIDNRNASVNIKDLEQIGLTNMNVDPNPIQLIGSGSYSVVSSHSSEDGKQTYAVKRAKGESQAWNRTRKEASIWVKLHHDNVLPLLGYWTHPKDIYPSLVTPLCPNGTVESFLRSQGGRTRQIRLSFLHDTAKAMHYLHSENIAHGDLRAANILIQTLPGGDIRAVLCDFGIALDMSAEAKERLYHSSLEQQTNDNWLAPELLFAKESVTVRVSFEGDVFAFGCVILEIMFNKKPYGKHHPDEVRKVRLDGTLPALRDDMDDSYWQIAKDCWQYQKEKRPASSLVLSSIANLKNQSGVS